MSETKQTRCPFCNSVFNITDAQLAARGGHVRCGSCLQVFRADQNIVTGSAAAPSKPAPAKPAPAAPTPAPAKPVAPPIVAKTQSAVIKPEDQPIGQRAKKKKLEDDSWAFNLIGGKQEANGEQTDASGTEEAVPAAPPREPTPPPVSAPAAKTKKPLFDDELSDMLHEAWQEKPSEGHQLRGPGEVEKIKDAADDSWATALLSEIAEEEKKEQAKNYSMEVVTPGKKPKEPPRDLPRETPREAATPAVSATAAGASAQRTSTRRPNEKSESEDKSASDDDLLNFLNSNSAPTLSQTQASLPVEIHHHRHLSVNWSYYFTWSVLCILAAAALIAQYVYFNFDALAISADTRPRMVQLCDTFKCELPSPPDTKLLNINKLVVRKHPEVANALQADAILYNKASFTQPLPALKLVLLDKKGGIVAGRVFTPKEYLPSDFSNLRRIPPDTPIHVELALVKPDAPFFGYRMEPLL
ncbi:putative Zn finger-like uncharacterized protein [Fluviicoccus keumensis]|uniref:Putative Zn finger-like uncharacterized protein n=1 Tax=Fluviicoccus keumensis TaxID=1435465 RepID=A0A4Q7YHF2_9GAMM|nr:zinc-ribbon and DUF3426 domain-containing protein [Fluviicoccus keumensis]RZU36837.1 putative Zn finger-like uncharacterized protein [Fluviicoccus keumensis]